MSNRRRGGGNRSSQQQGNTDAAFDRSKTAADHATEQLAGAPDIELEGRETLNSVVRTIARQVSATQNRLTGGNTLETMARLRQDSLLSEPVASQNGGARKGVTDGGQTLKDALDKVEASMINDIFSSEKGRTDDYITFQQIYDLITQASEAVQSYCDNIVSPDDFTKRDVNVFYEGEDADGDIAPEVRKRASQLIEKYKLEDRLEEAIVKSLTKGDYFVAVFNLRQELEGLLNEDGNLKDVTPTAFTEQHVPVVDDADMQSLIEHVNEELGGESAQVGTENIRKELAAYFNDTITFQEDAASDLAKQAGMAIEFARDLPSAKRTRGKGKDRQSLSDGKIRGSVVKMVPPENVVKLYQDDTLFGYYMVELSGPSMADLGRGAGMDQTSVVRAIDQSMSTRTMGGDGRTGMDKGKEALIGRIIVKTLSSRMGNAKFLVDNEELASDAYAIMSRARREKRRVTFTYVAPDQMVHFTPNGSTGYGESVLSRVKFLAKLYIGAMTNAFMRNSIRRPERLVWYVDVGADNDGGNAIQNFIRTIKQREVKFSHLRDITTTMNQIGEFHDFYVPTYNGERPVEVETLNMGAAAEVDSPFLEYLRKSIIGGTGVPAAFLGYSEEVAFARSLTMDNGRFLRRVVRHQKHYGRSASLLLQILYRNEFLTLEELEGKPKPASQEDKAKKEAAKGGKDGKDGEADDKTEFEELLDVSKILIRYPSPATLNMTNLADAINNGQSVVDFITNTLAASEEEEIQNELKKRVIMDLMPQVHWDRYVLMLDAAKKDGERKRATAGSGSDETSAE